MGRSGLPSTRFVIIGLPRTGSSLLGALLGEQPAIMCDTEILHPCMFQGWRAAFCWAWRVFPYPYITHRARRAIVSGARIYGFKVFPAHVAVPARLLAHLHWHGWRLVHIQRRDLFQQTLSLLVASHTGRYDASHADPIPRLTLDPARFGATLHQRVRDIRRMERMLAPLEHLDVVYEDDLADEAQWFATLNRVCGYLGAGATQARSDYGRTWPAPYEEIVVNYAHLCDAYHAGLFGERPPDC